jgi:hypothetical protein
MAFITKEQRNNPLFAPIIKDLEYANTLEFKGWTKVDYPYGYKSRHHAIDIECWVSGNLGEFWKMGRTYFFKDSQDALLFLLKYT